MSFLTSINGFTGGIMGVVNSPSPTCEEIKECADQRYANAVEVSAEGNSITLNGTLDRNFLDFEVLGESGQTQTNQSANIVDVYKGLTAGDINNIVAGVPAYAPTAAGSYKIHGRSVTIFDNDWVRKNLKPDTTYYIKYTVTKNAEVAAEYNTRNSPKKGLMIESELGGSNFTISDELNIGESMQVTKTYTTPSVLFDVGSDYRITAISEFWANESGNADYATITISNLIISETDVAYTPFVPDSPSPAYPAAITQLEPYVHIRSKNLINPADLIAQGWVLQADGSYYVASASTPYNKKIYENKNGYTGQYKVIINSKITAVLANDNGAVLQVNYTDGTKGVPYANKDITVFTTFKFITLAGKQVDSIIWTYGTSNNSTWIKDLIITKDLSVTSYIPPDSTDVYLGPDLLKRYPLKPQSCILYTNGNLAINAAEPASATEEYIPVKSFTYVTYFYNAQASTRGIAFYDENKAFISGVAGATSGIQIISIPVGAVFVRGTQRVSTGYLYFSDQYGNPTEGTLGGLKNYNSTQTIKSNIYIDSDTRKWYLGKYTARKVFDGANATWAIAGNTAEGTLRFNTLISGGKINLDNILSYLLCTHFKPALLANVTNTPNGGCYWNNGVAYQHIIFIAVGTNLISQGVIDIATWNAYLAAQATAGTPLTVEYALQTPIITEITDPILLEKLNSMHSLTGQTNIYLDYTPVDRILGSVDATAIQNINYALDEIRQNYATLAALNLKLDKSTEANKVYGTTATGTQTMYNHV